MANDTRPPKAKADVQPGQQNTTSRDSTKTMPDVLPDVKWLVTTGSVSKPSDRPVVAASPNRVSIRQTINHNENMQLNPAMKHWLLGERNDFRQVWQSLGGDGGDSVKK